MKVLTWKQGRQRKNTSASGKIIPRTGRHYWQFVLQLAEIIVAVLPSALMSNAGNGNRLWSSVKQYRPKRCSEALLAMILSSVFVRMVHRRDFLASCLCLIWQISIKRQDEDSLVY